MSVGATVRMQRAIASVLAQGGLCGARSAGTALMHATGGDVVLKVNAYAKPVIASTSGLRSIDTQRLVKTQPSKPMPTITAAGTAVPVMSMCGGKNMNLPVGTVLRWDPVIEGVEASSLISVAMSGGDAPAPAGLGLVQRLIFFEDIGGGDQATTFWAATGPDLFPAVAIAWENHGQAERKASGRQKMGHTFKLWIVASRLDGQDERRNDGLTILDSAREILCDRAAADGESFSNPPILLGPGGRFASKSSSSWIYTLDFTVFHSVLKRELRTFSPWEATRERFTTTPTTAYPPGHERDVADISHNQDPDD